MRITLVLLSFLSFFGLHSQVPPVAFHYSAVARDDQGAPLSEKQISIQALIRFGTSMGPIAYEEWHDVTTDDFGLFTLVIGTGLIQSGDLNQIDWAADHYFLQVGLDPTGGQQFTLSNPTQLLSVPYALHTKTAESVLKPEYQTLSISNDTVFLTNGGFVKLPPSQPSPSGLIQPIFSNIEVFSIGSNSVTIRFNIENVNDLDLTHSAFQHSFEPDIMVNFIIHYNQSRNGGVIEISNLPLLIFPEDLVLSSILRMDTTYYLWPRANTINGITFFGERQTIKTTSVGHQGPGGGIVYFDKGYYADGWRYMEILENHPPSTFPWGCQPINIIGIFDTLGYGPSNTTAITQQCNDPMTAALYCQDLNSGGYSDWFLPSFTELKLAYFNLHSKGLGNFQPGLNYWTSTQSGPGYAFYFSITPVPYPTQFKSTLSYIRPVRRF